MFERARCPRSQDASHKTWLNRRDNGASTSPGEQIHGSALPVGVSAVLQFHACRADVDILLEGRFDSSLVRTVPAATAVTHANLISLGIRKPSASATAPWRASSVANERPPDSGEEGRRDMPQVGASQVACFERCRVLGSKRPVGQNPFDPRDGTFPEVQILACEYCPQFGSEQVGRDEASEFVQTLCACRRIRFVEGNGRQYRGIDVSDAHSPRSARNLDSAPGRRSTGRNVRLGTAEWSREPLRSRSFSRSSSVGFGRRRIERISATGSPR